jgi:hypothetical protein
VTAPAAALRSLSLLAGQSGATSPETHRRRPLGCPSGRRAGGCAESDRRAALPVAALASAPHPVAGLAGAPNLVVGLVGAPNPVAGAAGRAGNR